MKKIEIVTKTIHGILHPSLPNLKFLDALCEYDDVGLLYQCVHYAYTGQERQEKHQIRGKDIETNWIHSHYKLYLKQYELYYATVKWGHRPMYHLNDFQHSYKNLLSAKKALLIKLIT